MVDICQEARRPASYIWLRRCLQRVLGLDLTFRTDWRQKWLGQWIFFKRKSVGARRKLQQWHVGFDLSVPTETGSPIISNHKTPSQSELLSLRFEQLYTLWFLTSELFRYDTGSLLPSFPPQFCTEGPWGVFSAVHGCRCNPSKPRCHKNCLCWDALSSSHDITVPISVLYLFFSLALCLRYPCWHPRKRFHPSLQQPDNVAALQGEKSEVLSQHTTGSGNGFECRSRVAHMWGIFSLWIQEIVEEQQPRGGVLAPVAAEAESSVSLSLVFLVFIIQARCRPLGPRGGTASICFDGMNHSCLSGTSFLKKYDLRLLPSIFKIDCVFP